jgi:beta-galactosidase
MPSVTLDGRSLMIDGRRVWIVSGRVPYARLPRETWADRIRAARHMGLNTIETPVIWNRHEVRPGKFDFSGDNDLRHFLDLVGKAGMHCILGLGPYVGGTWDFGGIPSWLSGQAVRTSNPVYLEACSRFIGAVAEQVKGWQVTAPGAGGPVLMIKCESNWTCGHDQVGQAYLGELTRYIRESGLNLPIINSNNLWQSIEGQIDGWAAGDASLATVRQLGAVRPNQPRIVIDLPSAEPTVWGREAKGGESPARLLRRLAEVLAGGGQFNLTSFCGGTFFGFSGGRLGDSPGSFATTSQSLNTLIREDGSPAPAYWVTRRLVHAASRFGRVFANLDPAYQPVAIDPPGASGSCSVVHVQGQQGGVVLVFGDEPDATKPRLRSVPLLLPDGTSMVVPVASNSVAWCLLGVNVGPRSRLDYTNLSAMGTVGQAMVLFAPAGSEGVLSVNGSRAEVRVPDDNTPLILDHEGLAIAILSEEQTNRTFFTDDAIFIGVEGMRGDGTPIEPHDARQYFRLGADGTSRRVSVGHATQTKRQRRPSISAWSESPLWDFIDGSSPRYAAIDGPADLATLGCPVGYGWYRISFEGDRARHVRAAFPAAGDRLHFFSEGKSAGIAGVGPGAEARLSLPIRRGPQTLVVLVENFGRFSEGTRLGEGKGLIGEAYEVVPLKVGRPEVTTGLPLDPLEFRVPLWHVAQGDTTGSDRVTWKVHYRAKSPVLMSFESPPDGALLVVNDKVVEFLDASGPAEVLLDPDWFGRGTTQIQVVPLGHGDAERLRTILARTVSFEECVAPLFAGASMAFARWEAVLTPNPRPKRHHAGVPTWWHATLMADPSAGPVWLDLAGMTKGQVYVNGRHLGRYFVATSSGRRVPPQSRYHVPASWLRSDGHNDLVLFDEHGANPTRVRALR